MTRVVLNGYQNDGDLVVYGQNKDTFYWVRMGLLIGEENL